MTGGWCCSIDLDRPGKQVGQVSFPDSSPGPAIAIPLTAISNGAGPTIVLTAGVHGDEYEGQIALSELARDLSPDQVAGRIIILPALNTPACLAGQRLSPIDNLNLNRVFPGDAGGTITQRLASFVESELYSRANFAVDFHAGGMVLDFLPATVVVVTENGAENSRRIDLARAFGASHCMLFGRHTMGVEIGIDGAMVRHGIVGISGEYGGSARVGREPLAICREGVRRVLSNLDLVDGGRVPLPSRSLRLVDVRSDRCYVVAPSGGVFEPLVHLGDTVRRMDTIGLLHRPDATAIPPAPLQAGTDGTVMAMRAPALTEPDDWMFIIGEEVRGIALEQN